jgi:hypothetical protein
MSTTYRVPGAILTEREHSVPLDYPHPGGLRDHRVYPRGRRAGRRGTAVSPLPAGRAGLRGHPTDQPAVRVDEAGHRGLPVLLLDQRGTVRSTPVGPEIPGRPPQEQACRAQELDLHHFPEHPGKTRVRRTRHRLYPPRAPGSLPHPERGASPPALTRLHRLLQHRAATPIARPQQSPATRGASARAWVRGVHPTGRWAPSPLAAGGLIAVGHPACAHSFASTSTAARGGMIRRTRWPCVAMPIAVAPTDANRYPRHASEDRTDQSEEVFHRDRRAVLGDDAELGPGRPLGPAGRRSRRRRASTGARARAPWARPGLSSRLMSYQPARQTQGLLSGVRQRRRRARKNVH